MLIQIQNYIKLDTKTPYRTSLYVKLHFMATDARKVSEVAIARSGV